MKKQIEHSKRTYGYMSCVTLLFIMAMSYPAKTDIISENNSQAQQEISSKKEMKIPSYGKRTYYMGDKPVTVDTSKSGWAVDLLLEKSIPSN